MALVGRPRRTASDGVAPGVDDDWPEGWTDEELQTLAGDSEPSESEPGHASHDGADTVWCRVG